MQSFSTIDIEMHLKALAFHVMLDSLFKILNQQFKQLNKRGLTTMAGTHVLGP